MMKLSIARKRATTWVWKGSGTKETQKTEVARRVFTSRGMQPKMRFQRLLADDSSRIANLVKHPNMRVKSEVIIVIE